MPIDFVLRHVQKADATNLSTYARQLEQRITEANTIARNNLHLAQDRQINTKNATLAKSVHPFLPDDLVWVCRYTFDPTTKSRKFLASWVGPATVLQQTSPVNYLVSGAQVPE